MENINNNNNDFAYNNNYRDFINNFVDSSDNNVYVNLYNQFPVRCFILSCVDEEGNKIKLLDSKIDAIQCKLFYSIIDICRIFQLNQQEVINYINPNFKSSILLDNGIMIEVVNSLGINQILNHLIQNNYDNNCNNNMKLTDFRLWLNNECTPKVLNKALQNAITNAISVNINKTLFDIRELIINALETHQVEFNFYDRMDIAENTLFQNYLYTINSSISSLTNKAINNILNNINYSLTDTDPYYSCMMDNMANNKVYNDALNNINETMIRQSLARQEAIKKLSDEELINLRNYCQKANSENNNNQNNEQK